MEQVRRVMRPGAYVFCEVPNGSNSASGPPDKIQIPHTYHFRTEYFHHQMKNIILNSTFSQHAEGIREFEAWWACETVHGTVIRALGQM
jgi:hypothetical protein